MSQSSLMVTGASGTLGRAVVEGLLAAGAQRVIAGTRRPEALADLADRGVDVRRLDFDDEQSLATAFEGVTRALIVSTDALGTPGLRVAQHTRAIRAAVAAGVQHLVYTSLVDPRRNAVLAIAEDHRATEEALAASGVPYTALRNNLYADLLVDVIRQAGTSGVLATARGSGSVGYVTRADCARAATAALLADAQDTRILSITGAEALDGEALAAIATRLTGRPVAHLALPVEAYVSALTEHGVPAPFAAVLGNFEESIAAGELRHVSPSLEMLTGRPPQGVEAFLRDALAV